MKKVFLVHRSGEKLGPFEVYDEFASRLGQSIKLGSDPESWARTEWTGWKYLGFKVEEAVPENITISKDALWELRPAVHGMSFDELWQRLCRAAKGKVD